MNYNILLDMAAEFGYQLAMCGAETFRIEDSICRIFSAYGIESEVFAIPNCLTVSIKTKDQNPMTRMRRIGFHGNNLDAVEKLSNLSRRICMETPSAEIAVQWLNETKRSFREYKLPVYLLGNFLGAFGFCFLFNGGILESLCAGLCGILIGIVVKSLDYMKVNPFFRTMVAAFLMALFAYGLNAAGIAKYVDSVIIGALMILVPGLLFTNSLRDIIYGDTNSGINRIVQVFLIAAAIAVGTGAALGLSGSFWSVANTVQPATYSLYVQCAAAFVACIGFFIVFNVHGFGGFLCAAGGMLTWLAYGLSLKFGAGDVAAYFYATVIATLYSEIMARVRKCPVIAYMVISAFPLIPGAGVYYTMTHIVDKNFSAFPDQSIFTLSVAAAMAVGILLTSSVFRFSIQIYTHHKSKNP